MIPSPLARLGSQIKQVRISKRIGAEALAQMAGISLSTVYKIEKGDLSVAMGSYQSVLAALGHGGALQSLLSSFVSIEPSQSLPKRIPRASKFGVTIAGADSPLRDQRLHERFQARQEKLFKDAQILDKHRKIISLLQDPGRREEVIRKASEVIQKWEANKLCSPRYISSWRGILKMPPETVGGAILDESDNGIALRQNSPFIFAFRNYK